MPVSANVAAPHYKTRSARRADVIVHAAGLFLAIVGGAWMVWRAHANQTMLLVTCVYALGLLTMFACSAAYNFAPLLRQPMLRKFDHAGIFVMIAGSYTPFFLVALDGSWRWAMILTVWSVALFGVFAKLCLPGIAKGFWVAIYLLLGWAGIVVVNQMIAGLDSAVLWLIVAGGAFYTVGVTFYVRKSMVYNRAIWHAHVLGGALSHWYAIWLCLRPVVDGA
ncbi:PAQR family membrane homeostasis protein TrhA [Xanthomonas vesicatoria]|uniref:PAQR family membrane homeostasis protein TrhA n=1 Tax=Xanthomonas vesicatoria TaxID=56460 RepID=UPI001E5F3766|nr:hemolysin III family protein [Xanthomonas vesicatoria]MCC8618897.1 hemolysin III family protein [Xanthomonas vesicatoria]MCC8632500.1 hemolysin III family protein [Xanthomonas vesicatoria]